jgi:hypothetical protein
VDRTCFDRDDGHDGVPAGEDVVASVGEQERPGDHVENCDVRLPADRYGSGAVLHLDGRGRVHGSHPYDVGQAVADRHELRHAFDQTVESLRAFGQIGTDRVGVQAALVLAERCRVAEVAPPDGGIEHHAAPTGLDHDRLDQRRLVAESAKCGGADVGEDIARTQLAEQRDGQIPHPLRMRALTGVRITDVHHQWQVVLPGDRGGRFDQRTAVLVHDLADQAQFQSPDQAGVILEAQRDGLSIDLIQTFDVGPAGHRMGIASYVQKTDHVGLRAGQDVSRQYAEVRDA